MFMRTNLVSTLTEPKLDFEISFVRISYSILEGRVPVTQHQN